MLDFFWYALPQEDFDNKWEAIGWPHKIQQQIDETELFLKQEEEIFYKIQIKDEFDLRDKIEILTGQVVQISQWKEFEKVGHKKRNYFFSFISLFFSLFSLFSLPLFFCQYLSLSYHANCFSFLFLCCWLFSRSQLLSLSIYMSLTHSLTHTF